MKNVKWFILGITIMSLMEYIFVKDLSFKTLEGTIFIVTLCTFFILLKLDQTTK